MIIQAHAEAGHDILKNIEFPWPIANMVWQHHERWDGSGYPQKLKGEDICLGARIIAVADTFDAITSHRPYRPGRSNAMAIEELRRGKGTAYDPKVIDAAIPLLEALENEPL
jgi:HD-GYP domain-containing protein (c-di-GMP phosphodiesterase class II)